MPATPVVTLIYGAVTGLLVAAYAGLILVLQGPLSSVTGSQTILFTFTAAAQSGTASLTVTGLGPADPSSVWISSGSISIGEVLTASYQGGNIRKNWPIGLNGTHVLTLDGCSNYLVLATTRPDCDFALEGRSS